MKCAGAVVAACMIFTMSMYPSVTEPSCTEEIAHLLDDLDLAELKKYIIQDGSLSQQECELLLEKISELEGAQEHVRACKILEDKIYGYLAVKNQLLAKNLTVCKDAMLNNLAVDGSFDICGIPACALVHTYTLLLAATSADVPLTIALRDSAGSFASTTPTATGGVRLQASNDNAVTLSPNPATDAYTFQLPNDAGLSHYVLTTDGTGITRWQAVNVTGGLADLNGLVASTQFFAVGTAGTGFNIVSAGNTHTFNLPLASTVTVTGGVISNTDYTHFVSTYTTVLAATALDVHNTLVLRDGAGSFAATNVSLQAANSNSVTLAPNPTTNNYTLQLPGNTGTNNYVLTTDGTGVTSWQALSAVGSVTAVTAGANISITGSATAPTINVAGTTQYNVQVGTGSTGLAQVAPSATAGIPLVSQGLSANPTFTTAVVAGGGTGATSFTPYSVVCGGTTSTSMLQTVTGLGTVGQVLTSNGAAALPSWQTAPGSMRLLQTLTAINTSTLIFDDSVITSAYATYFVNIAGINNTAGSTSLRMTFSTTTGLLNSGYQAGENSNAYNSATLTNVNATAFCPITPTITNANVALNGYMYLTLPQASASEYTGQLFATDTVSQFVSIFGTNSAITPIKNVRFFYSNGTIASGTISLYGVQQ